MSDIEHSIGIWTSILYRYKQSYLGKKLKHLNIGSGQHIILLILFRDGGISQEKLADYLKVDKGCIAKSIKKLEDESYIQRSIDSDDKRAYKVSLTQKGLNIIPEVQEALKNWENMLVADLSEYEKETLEQLLHKMVKKAYSIKTSDEERSK